MKAFADDNLKFDENERKFLKRIENSVGKGEIARYTPFPTVFSKLLLQTHKNQGYFGKGLILYIGSLDKCHTRAFNDLINNPEQKTY